MLPYLVTKRLILAKQGLEVEARHLHSKNKLAMSLGDIGPDMYEYVEGVLDGADTILMRNEKRFKLVL